MAFRVPPVTQHEDHIIERGYDDHPHFGHPHGHSDIEGVSVPASHSSSRPDSPGDVPAYGYRAYGTDKDNGVLSKEDGTLAGNNDPYTVKGADLEKGVLPAPERQLSEVAQAQKLMRTATWINTFFLITTDILGPTSAPYSVASMGYVPGSLLYFFCGIIAAYTGLLLQRIYLTYDTEEYPMRTYGDLSEQVFKKYGRRAAFTARSYTAFFQSLQLLLNVAVLILGSAQAMYQMANNSVCFLIMGVAFTGAGFLLGFIKQLKHLSHLSNFCIWINLFIAFCTVGIASYTLPFTNVNDPAPSGLLQAGFVPYDPDTGEGLLAAHGVAFNTLPLSALTGGIMNMVYAYGGATIFIEFMAEMKRPQDFWKALLVSFSIIMSCYLTYGIALYALQGPYVGNPGNQGIRPFGWQTALNALNLFTGLIAAVMYGNVGLKVIYITLLQEVFKAPALTTRKGTILWYISTVCFWWLAFVLAEAVPQFSAFTGIVSAICIMQFTYTLPPLLNLLMMVQEDATWSDVFRVKWYWKAFDLFVFLGSLVLMGMGLWGSIETLISALQQPNAISQFSCNGP